MAAKPRGKSKLTPEVKEKLFRALRLGSYIETAANYAGITRQTLYNWIDRGRKEESPYSEFVEELDQVLAEAELRDLAIIAEAAKEQWQAAAWKLERRYPDRWGRVDRSAKQDSDSALNTLAAAIKESAELLVKGGRS